MTADNWRESAALRMPYRDEEGNESERVFRMGDNGRFGYGEYGPLIHNSSQKYMWHFWIDKKEFEKSLKITAINQKSKEEVVILSTDATALAPNNGASHHIPSTINLPEKGLWKFVVEFDGKHFGSLVADVQ